MKRVAVVVFVILLLGLGMALSNAMAQGVIDLPQTGQTRCWDVEGTETPCAGTGQDGDIQAGVAWTEWTKPRFIITYCNSSGPCASQISDCDNSASNDVVTDTLTGLIWTRHGNLPGGGEDWLDAIDYANNLTLCGHADWRLPNINEIESLLNANEPEPFNWLNSKGFTQVQQNTSYNGYWSSTTSSEVDDWPAAGALLFPNGALIMGCFKGFHFHVWPVRSGQPPAPSPVWKTGQTISYRWGDDGDLQQGISWPNPRFTLQGDYATDNLTGLMWTKDTSTPGPEECAPGADKTWQEALDHVKCLNANEYLGHLDWRLPNKKELMSLVDRSHNSPALPAGHPFDKVQWDDQLGKNYWSSTSLADTYYLGHAWAIDLRYGDFIDIGQHGKEDRRFVWPVRSDYLTLTLVKPGTGTGRVVSVPVGIDCPTACLSQSAQFTKNTIVTLTAVPNPGSIFTGWSGCSTPSDSSCSLTLGSDTTITAIFNTPVCTYTISPTSKPFPAKGFGLSTNVTVTGTGMTVCPAPFIVEELPWVTATLGSWTRNRGSVKVTVSPSTQASVRTGPIAIGDKIFNVSQTGAPCTITALNPTTRTFTGIGGEQSFTVTTSPNDCSWRASSTQSWIDITSSSGTGDGFVTFSVGSYTGPRTRSGSIVVEPLSGTFSSKKTFTVKQTK